MTYGHGCYFHPHHTLKRPFLMIHVRALQLEKERDEKMSNFISRAWVENDV